MTDVRGTYTMSRASIILVSVVVAVGGCTSSTPDPSSTTVSESEPMATTSPAAQDDSTAAPGDALNPVQTPPPLVVVTAEEATRVPGYDYCWGDDDSAVGICADSFGRETPTPITIDAETIPVMWIDDAVLSALVHLDGHECGTPLLLEASEPGEWVLAMPPNPGIYRVGFHGTSGPWDSLFAIELTSTVHGRAVTPYAEVSWPNTTDQVKPSIGIYDVPADVVAELTILSADGVLNTVGFERVQRANNCPPSFRMVDDALDRDLLGATPYTASLLLESPERTYEASWQWPADLNAAEELVGSMEPLPDSKH